MFGQEDDAFSDADNLMANIMDPSVWQGGREGVTGEGVKGDSGAGVIVSGSDAERSTDFVSVSHLHDKTVRSEHERRGRKRPRPSDPEL